MEEIKKRGANWSKDEELVLMEEALKREGVLFGKMKGVGAKKIGEVKEQSWQEIVDILNSRFSNSKRDTSEVKKKYYNIKTRSKEKRDKLKRPKTGGGPLVRLNPAEEAFLNHMGGRPQLDGLSCGIDTDELQTDVVDVGSQVLTSSQVETLKGLCTSVVDISIPEMEMVPLEMMEDQDQPVAPSSSSRGKNHTSKRHRSSLAVLEEENLKLDNQRLKEEIQKIRLEKEILEMKKIKILHELQGVGLACVTSESEI